MEERALPPAFVLVSDGMPTDDFGEALDRLLALPWGARAVRMAVAIGQDADYDTLHAFIADPSIEPVTAVQPRAAADGAALGHRPRRSGRVLPRPAAPPPVQVATLVDRRRGDGVVTATETSAGLAGHVRVPRGSSHGAACPNQDAVRGRGD